LLLVLSFLVQKGNYDPLYLQLAKLAGNTVVATCGGEEKALLLKKLGVDRVIDYRAEDIKTVCLVNPHFLTIFHVSFFVSVVLSGIGS
jgi:D-arabinose 1-dehydrogenase-like Zn-dependent alcohol dehydrogenase